MSDTGLDTGLDMDSYYLEHIKNTDKLYHNYLGIVRKDNPKWTGWKIITRYKNLGIGVKEIQDIELDLLVKNFYFIQYLRYT